MAHNITQRKNGKSEMAYVGETPWHGLGQQLKAGASIEEWCKAAGMDWKVLRSKVRFATARTDSGDELYGPRSPLIEWPERHVVFRSDNAFPLGLVSDEYKVVQPKQVLEFFRDLAAQNRYTLETAGTLKGGAMYWALAKISEAEVAKGDKLKGYLLLSTSADGSRKTVAKGTSIRVVCNNTLDMADREHSQMEVTISHRSEFDEKAVKSDLGLFNDGFEAFMKEMRSLTKVKLTHYDRLNLTVALLTEKDPVTLSQELMKETIGSRQFQTIDSLYAGAGKGAQLTSSAGTAWGWVNAVTEYVDFHRSARTDETRLRSAWFGSGRRLKDRALELALARV